MESKLHHPELFRLPGALAPGSFGFSQEWFPLKWQRTAGCGPTTAAFLYYYLSQTQKTTRKKEKPTQETALTLMEQMWSYMTPGLLGLFNPHHFIRGFNRFTRNQGHRLSAQGVFLRGNNQDPARVMGHIHMGLRADAPVAFLNLHSTETTISGWHWTTIVALTSQGSSAQATILDYGNKRTIPLDLWLSTFPTVGAFIWFSKNPNNKEIFSGI